MNTENEFQLTLPSNASITFSPDNKPANYTTTLPSPISLEGEWEVALIDIQYPHNWMNITKDVYILFLIETKKKDTSFRKLLNDIHYHYLKQYEKQLLEEYKQLGDKKKKIEEMEIILLAARIPTGYYANVAELITTLNQEIQDSFSANNFHVQTREQTKEVNLLYTYSPIERMVRGYQTGMVELPEIICLDKQVKSLLTQANSNENQVHSREKLLLNTIPSIYIYTDIIKYQFVGDVKVPVWVSYQFKA